MDGIPSGLETCTTIVTFVCHHLSPARGEYPRDRSKGHPLWLMQEVRELKSSLLGKEKSLKDIMVVSLPDLEVRFMSNQG